MISQKKIAVATIQKNYYKNSTKSVLQVEVRSLPVLPNPRFHPDHPSPHFADGKLTFIFFLFIVPWKCILCNKLIVGRVDGQSA